MCTFIDPIPKDCIPPKNLSSDFDPVFRGTRSIMSQPLTYLDFLPTYIEHPNRVKKWESKGFYALSLFKSLESCKNVVLSNNKLKREIKSFSKGKTTISKGLSFCDSGDHVSYFLYDYRNNSPASDFMIIEDI